ncbi:hypothetical protein [Ammoniphilus sp. 3BR4]|uniref:hypothetical protein n=1 Tax=Ammoniphilus sp. 3BR4 TaxID=3158265 RepID=UPI0034651A0E
MKRLKYLINCSVYDEVYDNKWVNKYEVAYKVINFEDGGVNEEGDVRNEMLRCDDCDNIAYLKLERDGFVSKNRILFENEDGSHLCWGCVFKRVKPSDNIPFMVVDYEAAFPNTEGLMELDEDYYF